MGTSMDLEKLKKELREIKLKQFNIKKKIIKTQTKSQSILDAITKSKFYKILEVLNEKEYNIYHLSKKVGIAYNNILPHLNVLENRGYIKRTSKPNVRGKQTVVTLTPIGKQFVEIMKIIEKYGF